MSSSNANTDEFCIERSLFTSDHEIFRNSVRRFVETELVPHHAEWEDAGIVSREAWLKAGEFGLLCPNIPETYGGPGADWLHNVIVIEELARYGISGPAFSLVSDVVAPYVLTWASEDLKHKWLPKMVSGEAIAAIAMTEPDAGSDLKNIRTRAVRDGDDWIINGQKVYISNGQLADFVIVACKTDIGEGARGVSLILVETDREGFRRGRNLDKIGLKAQDTSELFFDDVRVPVGNLLGEEGRGFRMLMTKLTQERLLVGIGSTCTAEAAIRWTVEYTRGRKAFGGTIADFQNTQFVLAQLATETTAARVFTDWCVERFLEDKLTSVDAAKLKLLTTELAGKVVDQCMQFFGGYGYMREYPISRAFIDGRIKRIAGGASEIMKQIISRDMFK